MKRVLFFGVIISLFAMIGVSQAQVELAAQLNVTESGVDVQRVNTAARIAVNIETVIGVGDTIYTNDVGGATINFFEDVAVDIEPNTIYRIEEFTQSGDNFTLRTRVLVGNVVNRIDRELTDGSNYIVETPGMTNEAVGTVFAIRVEPDQRSSTIVQDGTVGAEAEGENSSVPAGFGVRSGTGEELSDVVPVFTFEELDSNLDGCGVAMTTTGDVSLNVRLGPELSAAQVGFILASEIDWTLGTTEANDWYRVDYAGHFGWVQRPNAEVAADCAGLREYATGYREDTSLYVPTVAQPVLVAVETDES